MDGATVVVVQWRRLAVILAAAQTEDGEHGEVDEQFDELEETDDGAADPQTKDAAEVRDEVYRLWNTQEHM